MGRLLSVAELVRLALCLRLRLRGRYWRWRMETAMGAQPPGLREQRRAALAFGAWRRRMRTM